MTGRPRFPRFTAWLLGHVAPQSIREPLLGDLEQEFARRVRDPVDRVSATRWYLWQAVRSLPHLLRERAAGGRLRIGRSCSDIRHAVLGLRRSPTFTLVAVATLTLGIGANTVVFTFVHGGLVEPLPFPEAERLFVIQQVRSGSPPSPWLSVPDFRDIGQGVDAFQAVAAMAPDGAIVQGAGTPRYVGSAEVSPNYFDVLGVTPVAGRTFGPQDEEAARVVVSESFWTDAFGRGGGAVGSVLRVGGSPAEIVGVVPDAADLSGATEVWIPLRTSIVEWRRSRGTDWIQVVGRLAPGATEEVAAAELRELGASLAEAFPDTNGDQGFLAESLAARLSRPFRTPLLILMGAVALVLLMVCVNLAGLLLARGTARRREIATRIVLGVGRGRLFGQLLTESLVLGLLGGGLGVSLAVGGVPLIGAAISGEAPRLAGLTVDAPVLLFSAGLALGATVAFGLLPAWGAVQGRVAEDLSGRGATAQRGRMLLRRGLVVGQVTLAVVVLVGGSVLLRSFTRLYAVDPGVRTEGVVSARLPLLGSDFPSTAERNAHYRRLLDAVRDAPGVEAAAMVNALPLRDDGPTFAFSTEEATPVAEQDMLAGFRAVLGDYFEVMGIELVAGRTFGPEELSGAVPAVVVDRTFERRFFPEGALGKQIETVDAVHRIVGVVEPVIDVSPARPPRPKMYLPLSPNVRQTMAVVARGPSSTAEATAALRSAVRAFDPRQVLQSLVPMSSYRSRSVQRERLVLGVFGAMGSLALVLAALGTYGVLAYLVSLRSGEIGVRMALGASRGSVRSLILASGARMLASGLLLGVVLAAVGARYLEGLLYETPAFDPVSFGSATLILVATALLASWLPARRAMDVSPAEALRGE